MVKSTTKSTYLKELLFPFFKIFYTLIVHYVINFVFSIGKQPYRDVINFVSYIHDCSIYSYNDINFTYLYMRTNYSVPNFKWSASQSSSRASSRVNYVSRIRSYSGAL